MAFRYKLPSGEIIEVDSAREMQELLNLLHKDGQAVFQSPPVTASVLDSSTRPKPPSMQDFLSLWANLETDKSRNVMRFFAKYGKEGLTSEKLAQYLGVKKASGIMSGINRQSDRLGFNWKRWFPLNNGVYEPDPTAYKNLVEAIAYVEPQEHL